MRADRPSRLLQLSIAVFAIGLVAIVALFVTPIVAHGATVPTVVYVLTMCAPLGLLSAVIVSVVTGRTPTVDDSGQPRA